MQFWLSPDRVSNKARYIIKQYVTYFFIHLLSTKPLIRMNYSELYQYSINEKEKFWAEQARMLKWFKEPTTILSKDEKGFYHWFADGEMNTCYLCLDFHVEQGRGERTALIYDSPVTNTIRKYSYAELKNKVSKFAGGLQ